MSCFSENVYYVLKISKICSHINHYYRIILPRSWKMTPIISFCLIMRTQKLCFEFCTEGMKANFAIQLSLVYEKHRYSGWME